MRAKEKVMVKNNKVAEKVIINIDGEKFHQAVLDSPFTLKQVCSYVNKNDTAVNDARRRNRINAEDLKGICKLIGKRPEIFYAKVEPEPARKPLPLKAEKSVKIEMPKPIPEYKPEVQKPAMTAREDPSQNWLVNIYRAIEDQTDRMDIQVSKASDTVAAIRGLREAVTQQTEVLRKIYELLS